MATPPERDDLNRRLDPRDRRALYSPEVMRAELGIAGDVYDEANQYVEDELMASIPMEGTANLRAEAIAFGRNDALTQYGPNDYNNNAADPISGSGPLGKYRGPSSLSEVPTSTSNPDRPRTVAAGYDPKRGVLTLVFRDGTFYNYYEVTSGKWQNFRGLASKGHFIRDELDSHPRGPANTSDIGPEVLQAIYQVARTSQTRLGGKTTTSQWTTALKKKKAEPKYTSMGKNPAANKGKPRPGRPRARRK